MDLELFRHLLGFLQVCPEADHARSTSLCVSSLLYIVIVVFLLRITLISHFGSADAENITPQLRLWLHSQSNVSTPTASSPTLHPQTDSTSHTHSSSKHPSEADSSATSAERNGEEKLDHDPTAVLMSSSVDLAGTSNPLYALKNEYDRTNDGPAWIEEVDDDETHQDGDEPASYFSSPPPNSTRGHLEYV
jgi:hypothetical protein